MNNKPDLIYSADDDSATGKGWYWQMADFDGRTSVESYATKGDAEAAFFKEGNLLFAAS